MLPGLNKCVAIWLGVFILHAFELFRRINCFLSIYEVTGLGINSQQLTVCGRLFLATFIMLASEKGIAIAANTQKLRRKIIIAYTQPEERKNMFGSKNNSYLQRISQ